MIQGETCKSCDGRGRRTKIEEGEVKGTYQCGPCNGSGRVNPPSKGKRRFGGKEKLTDEELTLEEQTRAFLRKHGAL